MLPDVCITIVVHHIKFDFAGKLLCKLVNQGRHNMRGPTPLSSNLQDSVNLLLNNLVAELIRCHRFKIEFTHDVKYSVMALSKPCANELTNCRSDGYEIVERSQKVKISNGLEVVLQNIGGKRVKAESVKLKAKSNRNFLPSALRFKLK